MDEPDPNNEGSVIVSDTAKYEFKYDARGIASVVKDNVLMTETRVTSDLADRPSESVTRDANGNLIHKSVLNYDGKNRVKEFIDILPGSTHKTAYTYDADNRVTEVKYDNSDTHKVNLTYDLLNRITNRTVTNGVPYSTTYGYLDGDVATYGEGATTPLISTITQGSGANAMNFAYTYDNRGNITSETRFTDVPSDGVTVSYEYDELGQLIRVNDPNDTTAGTSGTTWIYTYDRGGNMVQRAQCAFTTDDTVIPMYTREYLYDENWKDQLVANGPYPLTYDAIGNLKTYGGWTYEWESGRQLKRQTQNTTVITYDYDNKGMRTRKIVSHTNGYVYTDYHYIYSGTKLIHLTRNTDSLYFYYDGQGRPAKVNYNGAVYTYLHNLQGDIVGIIDETGALVVEYKYNAWGTLLSRTGTMSNTLGYANPFRYRGYIFDDETWMYWLKSRYYYPELGRFILLDQELHSRILVWSPFLYCENNPINKEDSNGTASIAILYDGRTSGILFGRFYGKGFKKQANDLISSLKKAKHQVDSHSFKSIEGFVECWGKLSEEYDYLILMCHGAAGSLDCSGQRIRSKNASPEDIRQVASFEDLNTINIRKTVFLFSCNGATIDAGGTSVAKEISALTNCNVRAVKDGTIRIDYTTGIICPTDGGSWFTEYSPGITQDNYPEGFWGIYGNA